MSISTLGRLTGLEITVLKKLALLPLALFAVATARSLDAVVSRPGG